MVERRQQRVGRRAWRQLLLDFSAIFEGDVINFFLDRSTRFGDLFMKGEEKREREEGEVTVGGVGQVGLGDVEEIAWTFSEGACLT